MNGDPAKRWGNRAEDQDVQLVRWARPARVTLWRWARLLIRLPAIRTIILDQHAGGSGWGAAAAFCETGYRATDALWSVEKPDALTPSRRG